MPNEIATMVAENNNETKDLIKSLHSALQGDHPYSDVIFRSVSKDQQYLPVRKIKDTVHFADKDGALFLQLADAFGYVFRGFLEGRANFDEFARALLREPDRYVHLREMPAGGTLVVPELISQKINPALNLPRIWSTIPGHEEIRPQ